MKKVIYCKFNMNRNPRFQTKTEIIKDGYDKYILKSPITEEGTKHITSFVEKYEACKKIYPGLMFVKPELNDTTIRYPFLTGTPIEKNIFELDWGGLRVPHNYFFKNGQNYFKKEYLNNKNILSNSCQNIVINSYASRNKKLNFNKTNINYFTNRNISYKLVPNNITGHKNLQQKPQKRKTKNDWLIGSYSAKEINKKTLRQSSDSFGLKLLQRNNVKYRNNGNNLKSRLIIGKSPFQNMNKKDSVTLTDRKAKEQINNNLEKIDALSRNIRKIKENLKKSVDINKYNLSSVLLSNKSKSIISKKDNKKIIDQNDNAIKVYLMNKTRNKKGNNSTNTANLPSFKINKIKFNNNSRKDKENGFKRKINYKTINYSNSNNNIKINSKNTIDMFKEYTIMNYNKK